MCFGSLFLNKNLNLKFDLHVDLLIRNAVNKARLLLLLLLWYMLISCFDIHSIKLIFLNKTFNMKRCDLISRYMESVKLFNTESLFAVLYFDLLIR